MSASAIGRFAARLTLAAEAANEISKASSRSWSPNACDKKRSARSKVCSRQHFLVNLIHHNGRKKHSLRILEAPPKCVCFRPSAKELDPARGVHNEAVVWSRSRSFHFMPLHIPRSLWIERG